MKGIFQMLNTVMLTGVLALIIVNAVLDLVLGGTLVVLVGILLGLVLVLSVKGLVLLVKNSITIKAMMRKVSKVQFVQRVEVGANP